MAYQDLGPTQAILGIKDGTVDSPFNPFLPGTGWVALVQPQDLHTNETDFECYHVAVNAPVGSSFAWYRDNGQWGWVNQGWFNEWDPSQPLPLHQTSMVKFAWNTAFTAGPYNLTTNVRPTVTLWLRKEIPL